MSSEQGEKPKVIDKEKIITFRDDDKIVRARFTLEHNDIFAYGKTKGELYADYWLKKGENRDNITA